MYSVIKESGFGKVVTLQNTETNSSLMIGKVSTKILDILGKDPYGPIMTDAWNFAVSADTAKALAELAMPMKKPVRKTKTKDEASEQKNTQAIDALDVIYGLAKYNN